MKRKFLSYLLCLCMVFVFMPMASGGAMANEIVNVASVTSYNGTYFFSDIDTAIMHIYDDNEDCTLNILADCSTTETIDARYNDMVIDLKGHSLTCGGISITGDLTIKGGTCSIEAGGMITNGGVNFDYELIIDNAEVTTGGLSWNPNGGVQVKNSSTLNISQYVFCEDMTVDTTSYIKATNLDYISAYGKIENGFAALEKVLNCPASGIEKDGESIYIIGKNKQKLSSWVAGGSSDDSCDYEFVANQDKTHSKVCKNCGKSTTEDCTLEKGKTVEPGCTEKGYTEYQCSACEYVYKDDYKDEKGHTYGNWTSNNDGTHSRVCVNNDDTQKVNCSYSTVETKPTCTEEGYTTYTCGTCGYSYDGNYADPNGHTFTKYVSNNDATCTQDGTETAVCDNCSATDTKEAKGSKLGHSYGNWTSNNDGTHSRVCVRNDDTQKVNCSYSSVVTKPTCTEEGYTTYTCDTCGYSYDGNYADPNGHTFTKYVSNNDATCTQDGTETAVCDNCSATDTRAEEGSQLGHDFGEWTPLDSKVHQHVCSRDSRHEEKQEHVMDGDQCEICGYVKAPEASSGGGVVKYPVTVAQDIEGGTFTASVEKASYNETVTVTAVPSKGYAITDISVVDKKDNKIEIEDKGDGVYTFLMPKAEVTVSGTFSKAGSSFADVDENSYYYDAVEWAVKNGIAKGTDTTHFSPEMGVTRAHAVTFLYRVAGEPEVASENPFVDVPKDSYYYDAVTWAASKGITIGTDDTHFSPDMVCSRAHIVTFLARANEVEVSEAETVFKDVDPKAYYSYAVEWAVEKEITTGVSETQFAPDNSCTRAQIVTFIYRGYAK